MTRIEGPSSRALQPGGGEHLHGDAPPDLLAWDDLYDYKSCTTDVRQAAVMRPFSGNPGSCHPHRYVCDMTVNSRDGSSTSTLLTAQ